MIVAARRLARLEAGLSGRQAVLLWLAEARGFASLAAYGAEIEADPDRARPLERILDQVERATRAAHRRERPAAIASRVAAALGEATQTYELILRIDLAARRLVATANAQLVALTIGLDALDSAGGAASGGAATLRATWSRWSIVRDELSTAIAVEEDARAIIEGDELGGRSALFAETADGWRDLRRELDQLAGRAALIAQANRYRPRRAPRPPASTPTARATARADRMVALARQATRDVLGQTDHEAATIEPAATAAADWTVDDDAVRALDRLTDPRDPGWSSLERGEREPLAAQTAHPLDLLTPTDQARQLRLLADEYDPPT